MIVLITTAHISSSIRSSEEVLGHLSQTLKRRSMSEKAFKRRSWSSSHYSTVGSRESMSRQTRLSEKIGQSSLWWRRRKSRREEISRELGSSDLRRLRKLWDSIGDSSQWDLVDHSVRLRLRENGVDNVGLAISVAENETRCGANTRIGRSKIGRGSEGRSRKGRNGSLVDICIERFREGRSESVRSELEGLNIGYGWLVSGRLKIQGREGSLQEGKGLIDERK